MEVRPFSEDGDKRLNLLSECHNGWHALNARSKLGTMMTAVTVSLSVDEQIPVCDGGFTWLYEDIQRGAYLSFF